MLTAGGIHLDEEEIALFHKENSIVTAPI